MKFNIIEAVNNKEYAPLLEYYNTRCNAAKYLSKKEFLKRTILSLFIEHYMVENYQLKHSESDWCIFNTECVPRKHAPDLVSYSNKYYDVKVVNNKYCVKYQDCLKYTFSCEGLIIYNLEDKTLKLIKFDSSEFVLEEHLDLNKIYPNLRKCFDWINYIIQ